MTSDQTFPRNLTTEERNLTRWIIQNGAYGSSQYLQQLDRATVSAQCKCGCASVDFAIEGIEPNRKEGMEIIGDFVYGDESNLCGAFVFACGRRLAGLDVYPLAADNASSTLPNPLLLRPFEKEAKKTILTSFLLEE